MAEKIVKDSQSLVKDLVNDTISRRAAIDAMEQAKEQYFDRRVIIGKMQDIVSNLPSAQPERKNGKWIVSHIPDSMLWECNQCGFDCGAHSFNFCPNCGADMRAEQDG